jgi:hypothetical protein
MVPSRRRYGLNSTMVGHFLPAFGASALNQKWPASLSGALPVLHLEEHVFRIGDLVADLEEVFRGRTVMRQQA